MIRFLSLAFTIFLVGILNSCDSSQAAEESDLIPLVIPEPVSIVPGTGKFLLKDGFELHISENSKEMNEVAEYLISKIEPATGYGFKMTGANIKEGIELILDEGPDEELGAEGYKLTSSNQKISIRANNIPGIFYGVQTLLQLFPNEIESGERVNGISWQVPAVDITDYPRFEWRGLMLDVSRHFFPKEYVMEYIDQMSRYKYNRFHIHLTDDQGWRIEIKSLPKLTEVGAWRVERIGKWNTFEHPGPDEAASYGGFFTQEDMKEIIAFAKSRNIEVIPEIDVPGHSMAAIAAYPELSVTKDKNIRVNPGSKFSTWHGNGNFTMHIDNALNPSDEKVYEFLDKVFTEIAELFPFEYIHMGGDECFKGFWEKDPSVKAFMAKNNLKDNDELQSYFVKRVNNIIKNKGKKAIGWDEILEGGLADGAAVMSWRGMKGGIEATHLKAPVVMSPSPMCYLDLWQGDPSVEPPTYSTSRLTQSYHWDPVPEEADANYILGGQGNLWTEQIPSVPQVEYMIYPRSFALSEVFWSQKEKKDWEHFVFKVENQFNRLDIAGINYAKSFYDPIVNVKKGEKGNLIVELETEVEGLDIYYTVDNTLPNHYYNHYQQPVAVPLTVDKLNLISYKAGKPVGKLISISKEELLKRAK